MSFDWQRFLDLADFIQREGIRGQDPEAVLRTSISRAYYFAYHSSLEKLLKIEGRDILEGKNKHARIIEYYFMRDDPDSYMLAEKLSMLREERNLADYEKRISGLSEKARFCLKEAREIPGLLRNIS